MRQEVLDRLKTLVKEKLAASYRDGWVYGRLKQEFDLQADELEAMAAALGFKLGWNSMVQEILDKQWQKDEITWMQKELANTRRQADLKQQKANIARQVAVLLQELEVSDQLSRELTDIERVLIALILKMRLDEQAELLETILSRYKV